MSAPRWENKDIYAAAIRSLRLRELQNDECATAVRAGLGSIIPLQLLTTLSPLETELRTCGLPYISLEFLKVSVRSGPSRHCLCPAAVPRTCGGALPIRVSQPSELTRRQVPSPRSHSKQVAESNAVPTPPASRASL